MHGIVILLITVFHFGVGSAPDVEADPITVTSYLSAADEKAVELQGCYEEAAKIKLKLEADKTVRGYDIRCGYVPVKDSD